MIRRGKAGDVQALQRLAQARGDTRVLQLIAQRSVVRLRVAPTL